MTDEEVLKLASECGWNVEHKATNDYLIRFARAMMTRTQKPVAWALVSERGMEELFFDEPDPETIADRDVCVPLFMGPVPRSALPNWWIDDLTRQQFGPLAASDMQRQFARLVERAHCIGGEP